MDIVRVALYIRVSTEEQVHEGYSLEAQRKHLLEYAKKNNYSVVDVYADEGITARKSYKKRKEFMRLISDVETGKIDLILFIKLDRWFRSVADYHKIQEVLEANNVGWRATTEQYDTTTAGGRLYVNIRLAVAQDEADRTSERIKFVFERKVAENEIISGTIPLGYRVENKKLVIDEEGAEIVRFAFDTYLALRSKRATAFKMKAIYGNKFTYKVVDTLLKNEKYIGKYRNNREYCPPIIEKSIFEEATKINKTGASRCFSKREQYFYIFSGLLFCPACGRRLGGVGVNKETFNYRYYRCNRYALDKICSCKTKVNEAKLEKYLLDNIAEEVEKYRVEYELNIKIAKKPTFNKTAIEGKLARLRELYINELIEIDDYKKEYESLHSELKKIESQIGKKEKDFSQLEALLQSDFRDMYASLDNEGKRALWCTIIEKIIQNEGGGYDIFFK